MSYLTSTHSTGWSPLPPSGGMPPLRSANAPSRRKRRPKWLVLSLCPILLILGVLLSRLLLLSRPTGQAFPAVGTMSFTSSGQVDPANTTGLDDGVSLSLHSLKSPVPGTAFSLWLLPDQQNDEVQPLLLGTLPSGKGSLHYTAPDHRNLLSKYSGVLVTMQATNPTPLIPTVDHGQWQDEGQIANTPSPNDPNHYSLLDHLRHLLAADPTLADNGMAGGLDIWLDRNTEKVLEWSTAARDGWTGDQTQQSELIHRHMLRILDALDGVTYVSRDVPANSPFLADTQASHFGLLNLFPAQDPPGLLSHVELHVQGLIDAPGHSSEQKKLAQTLIPAIDAVAQRLQNVRTDAQKLVVMDNTQLTQQEALSLMNDLVTNATAAFVGEPDEATGTTTSGVNWIHGQLQQLAVVPILPLNAEP